MRATDTLMTPAEVADLLKMHPRTVKRWMAAGKLPGFQLQSGADKGDWRARRSDIEAWLAARAERDVAGDVARRSAPTPSAGPRSPVKE